MNKFIMCNFFGVFKKENLQSDLFIYFCIIVLVTLP